MKNIIEDMIWAAWRHGDREMATTAYKLMHEFAKTDSCPPEWSGIGAAMAEKFTGWDWIEENCLLREF